MISPSSIRRHLHKLAECSSSHPPCETFGSRGLKCEVGIKVNKAGVCCVVTMPYRFLALVYSSYRISAVDATHSKYLLTNLLLSRPNCDVYLTACYTLYTEGVQIWHVLLPIVNIPRTPEWVFGVDFKFKQLSYNGAISLKDSISDSTAMGF